MNIDSQLFGSHYPPPKNGSKLAQVQNNLIQLFGKQQQGFGIPHKPIKVEPSSPQPMQPQQQPAAQVRKNPRAELTRKNMELFQQQQQQDQMQQQENFSANALDGMVTGNDIEFPAEKKHHHHHHHRRNNKNDYHDQEIAKLKETISTYDVNMNNLMQKLNAERESNRTATKELQRTNDILKNEVARIENMFRDMCTKRDDETKTNERLRQENDELLNKNLRLQHDLAQALNNCQLADDRCNEMKCSLDGKQIEKDQLYAQNHDLANQLERMRNAMSVWTQNAETTDKSTGHAFTCALGKVLFCGSVIAVSLVAFLQSVQAASDLLECDYESVPLN